MINYHHKNSPRRRPGHNHKSWHSRISGHNRITRHSRISKYIRTPGHSRISGRAPHSRAAALIGGALLTGICLTGMICFGRQHLLPSAKDPAGTVIVARPSENALQKGGKDRTTDGSQSASTGTNGTADPSNDSLAATFGCDTATPIGKLLYDAHLLAAGYDYDAAIGLLSASELRNDPANAPDIQAAKARFEAAKADLVKADVAGTTHIFFHSLIMDTAKAFDGDADADGYNQVMTTAEEFRKILQKLYDNGYVLVRMHDLAFETTDADGNPVMKRGSILLPPDKRPLVISQDDVCYYPYMEDDGFASRIVIGADGKPTCEMKQADGSTVTGSFDLVPILEDFIAEHPDFSYRGARAVLAFTGYEGILGYRTASSYADSPTYKADRQAAARVAQCLKDNGWELASHSWGHLDMGGIEMDRFTSDTDKWEEEVDSLIGPTDIILFPFGSDIGDWHPYSDENERFRYLYDAGFRYFGNVDSSPSWVQIGDNYLRQGRRNLDGYRMWKDITAESPDKRKLDDLFHAEDIFDSARPTPVPEM